MLKRSLVFGAVVALSPVWIPIVVVIVIVVAVLVVKCDEYGA